MISLDCTKAELKLIEKIADRFRDLQRKHGFEPADKTNLMMDLMVTHANGNPMRFKDLLAADDFNLSHDVSGIASHINRRTGKLERCFLPRFSK